MVNPGEISSSASAHRQSRTGRSLNTYPHQFFDPSSDYIPNSVKELMRWCRYLYMSHSEIAPVINKKCAYVITDLIYSAETEGAKDSWEDVLEGHIKLREMEFKLMVDREVYGNAFVSFYYPFERYLTCPKCKTKHAARNIDWKYQEHKFKAVCLEKGCNYNGEMSAEDKTVPNKERTKLIRWYPQYIEINYNPFADESEYIYRIPKWLRKKISKSKVNRHLVEGTRLEILEAVRDNKNIRLNSDNVYHFKNESVSMEDDAFGMPPLLAVFKDAWLFQTYRRAQESIALDHVLPMTLLIPAMSGGVSPHGNIDLADWSSRMTNIVRKWRRDPNGIFTVPFAADVQNIRGDAQALNVHNDMTQIRQQITGGIDVPQEFIYGGLNWCQDLDKGLVSSSKGLLYLRELTPDRDSALVAEEINVPGHAAEPSTLFATHHVGAKKALKLKTELGQTSHPSEDHKYWRLNPSTLGGEWVRSADLSVGDRIGVRAGSDVWGSETRLPKGEILGKEAHVTFPEKMSHELASVLGLLVSEGSITGNSRVSVTMADKGLMETYRASLSDLFGYALVLEEVSPEGSYGNLRKYRVVIYRAAAQRFLEQLVGTGYSADKSVPKAIRTAPKEFVATFLKALFEGDGSVGLNQVTYSSMSIQLLEEVQSLLLNFGIISRIYENEDKVSVMTIVGGEVERFSAEIGFISDRKVNALEELVNSSYEDLAQNLRDLSDPDMVWVEVRSIEDFGEVEMGDLTVNDTSSYLADGVVVHNSGSSISLRVLENLFIARKGDLDRFLKEFVIPKTQRFLQLPDIEVYHTDFKMADDVQQKNIALGLRQTNTVSDQTTIEELGFDWEKELRRREEEADMRITELRKLQLAQADIAGQTMIVQSEYQAKAQAAAQKASEEEAFQGQSEGYDMGASQQAMMAGQAMQPGAEGATPQEPGASVGGPPPDMAAQQSVGQHPMPQDPMMLDLIANHYIKTLSPEMLERELALIQATNPEFARAIKNRLKELKQQMKAVDMRPMSEQKPMRRENAPV